MKLLPLFIGMLGSMGILFAQTGTPIRVIAFGAHPDDCDIRAAGTAALFHAAGAAVKFVSVTNGDAGHQAMHGPASTAPAAGTAARLLGVFAEYTHTATPATSTSTAAIATRFGQRRSNSSSYS